MVSSLFFQKYYTLYNIMFFRNIAHLFNCIFRLLICGYLLVAVNKCILKCCCSRCCVEIIISYLEIFVRLNINRMSISRKRKLCDVTPHITVDKKNKMLIIYGNNFLSINIQTNIRIFSHLFFFFIKY